MVERMTTLSTHILDTSLGQPAAGVTIHLLHPNQQTETHISDPGGRCRIPTSLSPGIYTLTFHTGPYFAARNQPTLYPQVSITFTIEPNQPHYHIPLLLNPYGYTTYRGS
jgi:5-hydroxyisourate hydrolase